MDYKVNCEPLSTSCKCVIYGEEYLFTAFEGVKKNAVKGGINWRVVGYKEGLIPDYANIKYEGILYPWLQKLTITFQRK